MSLTAAFLASCTALLPQNIQLPPRPEPAQKPAPTPLDEVERFSRDLMALRGAPAQVVRALDQMAVDYQDVEALIIARLRPAKPAELGDLMVVARRFGSQKVADEILFQLLARPVGAATQPMLDMLVFLKGPEARKALRDCIDGRIAGVRRAATRLLAGIATAEELEFALLLSGDRSLDRVLAGVELLAAVPDERARQRLCELLARDAAVAGSACATLIGLGQAAVPHLQQLLAQPPIDRSFAYAAFALAEIGGRLGTPLVPEGAAPGLAAALGGVDPLARSLAAVALADLAYRGAAPGARDAQLVAVLLDVVEPGAFVPNIELLRQPSLQRLRLLTGREGAAQTPWRQWWGTAAAGFAGLRERIDVGADNVGLAIVVVHDDEREVRLLGEDLADQPVAGGTEYVLDKQQMLELVAALQGAGFMRENVEAPPAGLPLVRQLRLQVGGACAQIAAPQREWLPFDRLLAVVRQAAARELWQQTRHPTDEPERGAFWRAERRWLAAHPDDRERLRRFAQRVVKVWPHATPVQRDLVMAHLLSLPDRQGLLDEGDGRQLLGFVRAAGRFGPQEQALLELAALTPGDKVWRDCIDAAWKAPGGGREAVDKLFVVLGADRVLAALEDERPEVRRAALDEIVQTNDPRAGARIVQLFDDPDPAVARSAVFAAGQLQLAAARVPLRDRIVADDTDPALRREALRALGRVGGEGVFKVLQQAIGAPAPEDRDAALRGLGELRDARAAVQLAEIFASGPDTQTGELARFYLQRMGSKLAVPALRGLLAVQNPGVRTQVVLLLGGYQDPQVIPELVDLLRQDYEPLTVGALLAGTTGLDVATLADRVGAIEQWLRDHRSEPQWQWLLQALEQTRTRHSLEAAQFVAGAGLKPVPELARLMVEIEPPRLRVLAAAVLRQVTGEDFGQVSFATPIEVREGIAARYRVLYESARAAQGR